MPIDAHAHLSSAQLREGLPELLERARGAGVFSVINVATDPEELAHALGLHEQFPWVYPAVATPPQDVSEAARAHFPLFAEEARAGRLIALGETGLDYLIPGADRALQQEFLHLYFELATECNLPLIFHCRGAFGDLLAHIDEGYRGPFMVHCFTGTLAEAEGVIARGGYVSLSGILTFKRAEELRGVAEALPLERILIETDSPYLAPQSHRGEVNEPAYVLETLGVLAQLRGLSREECAELTATNARSLFRL